MATLIINFNDDSENCMIGFPLAFADGEYLDPLGPQTAEIALAGSDLTAGQEQFLNSSRGVESFKVVKDRNDFPAWCVVSFHKDAMPAFSRLDGEEADKWLERHASELSDTDDESDGDVLAVIGPDAEGYLTVVREDMRHDDDPSAPWNRESANV